MEKERIGCIGGDGKGDAWRLDVLRRLSSKFVLAGALGPWDFSVLMGAISRCEHVYEMTCLRQCASGGGMNLEGGHVVVGVEES